MYRFLIRPILFLLAPERIHYLLVNSLRILFRIPGLRVLLESLYNVKDKALETEFCGLKFKNPVGLAAGFDKNASSYNDFAVFGFGCIEVGTVTPLAQPGNPKPRSFRIPKDKGLINRMGFNNSGVENAVINLKKGRPEGLIIGANIGKNTLTPNEKAVEDYLHNFRELYDYADYFVVNVSCPNISDLRKLADQESLELILKAIVDEREKRALKKPVLLKISPDLNFQQVDETLEIVIRLGIDGIVATNTSISRTGLKTHFKRIQQIGNGGLSGAPLTARSLEIIRYISEKTGGKLPLIGVGGIMTVKDALNMLEAGATLIQVYSGFIYEGPAFVMHINKAISGRNRCK